MSSSSRTNPNDNNANGTTNHGPVSSSGFVADPSSSSHSLELLTNAADIDQWLEMQPLTPDSAAPAVEESFEDNYDDIFASLGLRPDEIQVINDLLNQVEPETPETVDGSGPPSLPEQQLVQDYSSTDETSVTSTPAPVTPQDEAYVPATQPGQARDAEDDFSRVELPPALSSVPTHSRKRKLAEYIDSSSVAGDEGPVYHDEPLPGPSNGTSRILQVPHRNEQSVDLLLPPLAPMYFPSPLIPEATLPTFTPPFVQGYAVPQWPEPQPHPQVHPQPQPSGSATPIQDAVTIPGNTSNVDGPAQQAPAPVQQNLGHLVEGVDYEVIHPDDEFIGCAVLITYPRLGIRVPCRAALLNQKEFVSQHMKCHGHDLPRTISECPFAHGPCKGTKVCAPATFARHVMSAHFHEKVRFRCLRCSRTYARKEEIQRNHPCAPPAPPQGEPSTAPAAGLVDGAIDEVGEGSVEGEGWVDENREEEDEGPVAGLSDSGYTEPDPPRPAKRIRRGE